MGLTVAFLAVLIALEGLDLLLYFASPFMVVRSLEALKSLPELPASENSGGDPQVYSSDSIGNPPKGFAEYPHTDVYPEL